MSEKDISEKQTESNAAQTAADAANAFRLELASGPQNDSKENTKTTTPTKTDEAKAQQDARPDLPPNIPIPPPPRFPDPWCRYPWDPMCPQKPDPLPDFPPKEKDKDKDKPKKPKK